MFNKLFKSKQEISQETPSKVKQALHQQTKNYFWNPKSGLPNIGDYLAFETVNFVLNLKDLHPLDISSGKILSIGSVLHFANDGDTVWGTGRNGKISPEKHVFSSLDVRSVRGPRTKDYLEKKGITVPEIFGDPGILAPLIYPKAQLNTVYAGDTQDVLIVPQLNDDLSIYSEYKNQLVSPRQLPGNFLGRLTKAKKVIASSLHGLILAEAYGIPAVYYSSGSGENIFKYHDYYEGTGRTEFAVGTSIEECMELETSPIPNLMEKQTELLSSFPFDKYQQTN
ncbi:MAG: polysaccharide pyruvyl transferase family protein [Alteromonas macleodii]|uniref:polysaccharide pyruvyl transferase family protein n=1 Tax=Alteromonas TaxID=226 RepID=UPI00126A7D50|nr:polysaccharide pyruvyl transferase family protein [Alteromonas macleodii]MDM7961871.1 polysaccharide pyruvyl transferase family protein [Alteromonas macleodii]MDM8170555.1 polysaccharide pyruvyl transferase family protein [Alteromonas macleodii]CAI3949936.1 pyruvyltransferase [Alteromonas macleodii]VTP54449.1 pyruvyltransferase [Alteromonas macleodii]